MILGDSLEGGKTILAILSGTAVALVGFFLNRLSERRRLIGQADLAFREQQIAEFYGPIYAFLRMSERIYPLWLEGKLHGINEEIKARFREHNVAISTIIATKSHLIDGPTIPDEMAAFITSVTIWNLYTGKQDGLPGEVAALPETKFPMAFRDYIFTKTQELKRELDSLRSKYRMH